MTDWSQLDQKLQDQKKNDPWAALDAKLGAALPKEENEENISSTAPAAPPTNTPISARFLGQNALLALGDIADLINAPNSRVPVKSPLESINNLLVKYGIVSPESANPTGTAPKIVAAAERGALGQLPVALATGGAATLPGLLKLGVQGATAGAGGEIGNELTPNHPLLGGLLGSMAGGLVPTAAEISAAKMAGIPASFTTMTPPKVNPQAAGPLQALQESGVQPSINQLFPGAKRGITQQERINKILAGSFGEDATDLKPDTFANASKRIGADFDDVAVRTSFIPLDAQYSANLANIKTRLDNSALSDAEKSSLQRMIDNVSPSNNVQQGQILPGIDGKQYQQYTQSGGQLSDLLGNDNSTVKELAQSIRGALDDAMQRAAPQDVIDKLQNARLQYKNMLMVKDFKPDSLGNIEPGNITTNRISNYYPNFYKGGMTSQDDLQNLLNGATLLKTPEAPSSSNALANLIKYGVAGGAGAAAEHFAPELMMSQPASLGIGLGVGGAALAAPALSRAVLNSDWYKNQLLKQALGQTPNYNPLVSSLLSNTANTQ